MRKEDFLRKKTMELATGTIDRRQFIMSAIATGATVTAAMTMADKAMAMAPKAGGTLRIATGYGSTTDVVDPSTSENGFTLNVIYNRGNHLTEVSNTGELIGELAESFEATDGAKKWVFNLRQGVEFHNGKTLTPEDVIATYQYHMGEDSKSAAKGLLSAVTNIYKDGDNQVIFELESGNADFAFIVSDYHLLIMPEDGGTITDPNSPVGTGGYTLDNFEPGVRANFTKFPNYWKEGRAHFDGIELLSVIDTTARQNAIISGDVDYADSLDPKTVNLMSRVPTLDIMEVTGTQHYTFPMRLNVEPFGNYDLRMALKHSLKRQELVDKVLLGHGLAGNDVPVSSAMPFLNTELPVHDFDADKARFHYEKSGHSGPIPLSVADAAFAGAVDAGQLIQASAAEAGIEIELVREPSDGYWSNVWNKKGWCACYWGGRPTQDWMYSAAYTADTEWNDTAWKDTESADRFNEVVVMARSETDQNKRKDLYWEAQALLQDDGGAIVSMWANYISAHAKNLTNDGNVAANWENDGNKIGERWWFS